MDMDNGDVGTYASFVARVGRASSELREVEGTTGDRFIGIGNNIVVSSSDNYMFDETTILVERGQSENMDNEQTLLVDKTTVVIPPEEIQGFLREKGINSRPRTGIKVKKDGNGQFICPICNRPFNRKDKAVTHSYTHMNQEELQKVNVYHQRCPHSPQKIFFNRQNYAQHINSHLGIKNFKCQICQKGFGRKGHLQYHMFTHVNEGSQDVQTPLTLRHFQCYFCHKKFGDMSHLMCHLIVHTMETPFKCSHCNKRFTRNSSMNYHIRRNHTHPDGPTPFPCPQCPRAFNERRGLADHIRLVHGEKLHHCSTCTKSFSTKNKLDRHVDGVHGKIRHQCPHCQKSYSIKSDVMRHMRKEHNQI